MRVANVGLNHRSLNNSKKTIDYARKESLVFTANKIISRPKVAILSAFLSLLSPIVASAQSTGKVAQKEVVSNSVQSFKALSNSGWNVVEKVENEIANLYLNSGKKLALKDTADLFWKLNIQPEQKPVVRQLLQNFDENSKRGYLAYLLNSPNLSPRKVKLKQDALTEIIDYSFRTGKVLRYSEENIERLAAQIGAKKDEIPFVNLFVRPYLDISQSNPNSGVLSKELFGDFK